MNLKLIAVPLAALATFAMGASPVLAGPRHDNHGYHQKHQKRHKVCKKVWRNHHRVTVCHWR